MVQRAEGTVEHVCVALPLYADAEGSCATWGGLWRSGAREHVCVPVLLFCAAHSHGVSLAVPLLVPHLIHMHTCSLQECPGKAQLYSSVSKKLNARVSTSARLLYPLGTKRIIANKWRAQQQISFLAIV